MSIITAPFESYGQTQGYGPTSNPAEPAQYGSAHFHDGRDYSAPCGTPIAAPFGGAVTFAGWDSTGYGNKVSLQDADGYTAFYGHLSSISVSSGAQVQAGTVLGNTGDTGNSTGCHVHVGAHDPNGGTLDPASFPAPGAPTGTGGSVGRSMVGRVLLIAAVAWAAWDLVS